MEKYKYVKILHEGEDYILVRHGGDSFEITGLASIIIKTLLKKINKKSHEKK